MSYPDVEKDEIQVPSKPYKKPSRVLETNINVKNTSWTAKMGVRKVFESNYIAEFLNTKDWINVCQEVLYGKDNLSNTRLYKPYGLISVRAITILF